MWTEGQSQQFRNLLNGLDKANEAWIDVWIRGNFPVDNDVDSGGKINPLSTDILVETENVDDNKVIKTLSTAVIHTCG